MTKPLRIGLVMQGGRHWMGGMEYIKNIILALASLPPDVRDTVTVSLVAGADTDRAFLDSLRKHIKEVIFVDARRRSTALLIKEAFLIRILGREIGEFDNILKTNAFDFIYPYMSWSLQRQAAAWICDFQHKHLPEFFSEIQIKSRDDEFSRIAGKARLIVMSSKTTEADFKKFYPLSSAKIAVLPFKVIPEASWYEGDPSVILRKYNLPDKFFIISNQFWQHKNHSAVFAAMKLLKKEGVNPVVVCTGHIHDYRNPAYSDFIFQTIHSGGLAHQVFLLGLIPKVDQIQLLRGSIALIQPSLFEGWSTVVEDARCMGKHIILSDFPVHLEQNPPNAVFFDRTSIESLAQVMAKYWKILSPGPDHEQEAMARHSHRGEVIEFGQRFLSLAHSIKNIQ